jgi:diguanylate cyclase
MQEMIFTFIENMSVIIAFLFLVIKLKNYIVEKTGKINILLYIAPLIVSFLSFSVMYYPFEYEGMRLDLRAAPLFFITFVAGWKFGILSAILPGVYRFYLGGPTVFEGIMLGILLPVLIGSLFHNKHQFTPPYTMVDIKKMFFAFFAFQLIKSSLMVWTLSIPIVVVIPMIFFATIAVLAMGLMVNDANRSLILTKELEFQSSHDAMTNMPNIRYFKNKVEKLFNQNIPIAIAMFDVDHFKHYNDTHGHPAGDAVLKNMGQILNAVIRKQDYIARYGGEEFIICFVNVSDRNTVEAIAERFRSEVERYTFVGEQRQPGGNLTISMGISFSSDQKNLDQLIEEADKALYQSKKRWSQLYILL